MRNKYFLSIKILDDIKDKVRPIINQIKINNNNNSNIINNIINEGEYHITLLLFYYDDQNDEDLYNLNALFQSIIQNFKNQFLINQKTNQKYLQVSLNGLLQLGQVNLVVTLEQNILLNQFINFLKDKLNSGIGNGNGINNNNNRIQVIDEHDWIPHMTLLKHGYSSKDNIKINNNHNNNNNNDNSNNKDIFKNDISKILDQDINQFKNSFLGDQQVYSIDLIKCGLPRDSNGYYNVKFNLPFNHVDTIMKLQ